MVIGYIVWNPVSESAFHGRIYDTAYKAQKALEQAQRRETYKLLIREVLVGAPA